MIFIALGSPLPMTIFAVTVYPVDVLPCADFQLCSDLDLAGLTVSIRRQRQKSDLGRLEANSRYTLLVTCPIPVQEGVHLHGRVTGAGLGCVRRLRTGRRRHDNLSCQILSNANPGTKHTSTGPTSS